MSSYPGKAREGRLVVIGREFNIRKSRRPDRTCFRVHVEEIRKGKHRYPNGNMSLFHLTFASSSLLPASDHVSRGWVSWLVRRRNVQVGRCMHGIYRVCS